MFPKIRIACVVTLVLSVMFVVPAFAGGWAVITLDELPTGVLAGEPLTIGFTVRQHGITPMNGLYPTVTAVLSEADRFVVDAEPGDKPGHYTATLIFPKEGSWDWSIQAFTMDQSMPELVVSAPMVAALNEPVSKIESEPASLSPLLLLRVMAFAAALVGLLLAFQRKSRLAGIVTGLLLVLGVSTFMVGAGPPVAEAQSKQDSKLSVEASPAQVELGRQLFIVKGCITCHYNSRAADRNDYWTIEMGAPDLSRYSSAPEILFIRLKDPAAAKSDTKMPNLELKETEIEALIAFINSK